MFGRGNLRCIPRILDIGESIQVMIPNGPTSNFLPEKQQTVGMLVRERAGDPRDRKGSEGVVEGRKGSEGVVQDSSGEDSVDWLKSTDSTNILTHHPCWAVEHQG